MLAIFSGPSPSPALPSTHAISGPRWISRFSDIQSEKLISCIDRSPILVTGGIPMTKTARLTTILAAGLVSFAAFAQEKPATKKKAAEPAGMPMPKPAAEMKELRDFIGVWTSDEKFEPSPMMPPGGTGTGTNTTRLGPGGFSVLMDQRSKSAMGPFSGHGVFTWDPNDKVYRFVWTDSMTPGVVIETGRKDGD